MDAEVLAALIAVPGSFFGAGLGVFVTNRHETTKLKWDLIHRAVNDLLGPDIDKSDDAQAHLDDILRNERLSASQRAWIRSSLQTYVAKVRRGSVENKKVTGGGGNAQP